MSDLAPGLQEPAFGYGINAVAAANSRALFTAADNLLEKAERSLATDEERARRLVARALALGYDPHERTVPAVQTATFRLFTVIGDAAEGLALDDQRWLDLAGRFVDESSGLVRAALVEVLAQLCDDGDLVQLQRAEQRRLRRLVLDERRRSGRGDVEGGQVEDMVPEAGREEFVLGVLRLTRDYRAGAELLLGST